MFARLTYQQRKSLPKSSFAIPSERAYPIEDRAHARNALARVSQHGSASEKKKVRAAVKRKYPGIEQTKSPAAGVTGYSNLPRAYGNADAGPSGVAGHTSLPQSAPLKTAPVPTEPI